MNVLLLSMPDSFEHMPPVAVRMPNGGLASLAGNVDAHHRVAIADLILARRVGPTLERLLSEERPRVVGLSVMTFQRTTALNIARFIRTRIPDVRIVVGGYDPSLAPQAYEASADVDFIVRGEGEHTFSDLLRELEGANRFHDVAGLSYRTPRGFVSTADRKVLRLASTPLRLPHRGARVLGGYTLLGRQVDVVETSRGCTYDCSFCSIIEMRGRNFHPYPIDRVMADIGDARSHGARSIFLVDDNITLDVGRFETLCQSIIDSGYDDLDYFVQAMTSPIAQHGARLAPLMRRAGFRYVFLGIENILESDLAFLKARAKNLRRSGGRTVGNATLEAIDHLHRNGLFVVGGLIVGSPDDTRESIEANLRFARRHVDWPYIQHPTPYPGTPMTKEFERQHLIVDENVDHYDGTTAVVRTKHLRALDVEFLRWRAERWMKIRHLPAAFRHSPRFVLRHWPAMLGHTFTGTSIRSLLGLETEWQVFTRFRASRQREREDAVRVARSDQTLPLEVFRQPAAS
ncbi:MAG: B12-binding domain-containing radical SAM protein [Acidobacteria bacterium]|nr:MAG: B12-binding domain-containing radical SAM protein [Acidobacteriota bacterium]PYR48765.1 MAG: B12-binding domain-containing radical SAM protein [Acidobacteriota bacterium]